MNGFNNNNNNNVPFPGQPNQVLPGFYLMDLDYYIQVWNELKSQVTSRRRYIGVRLNMWQGFTPAGVALICALARNYFGGELYYAMVRHPRAGILLGTHQSLLAGSYQPSYMASELPLVFSQNPPHPQPQYRQAVPQMPPQMPAQMPHQMPHQMPRLQMPQLQMPQSQTPPQIPHGPGAYRPENGRRERKRQASDESEQNPSKRFKASPSVSPPRD
ncbi:hypothetical protein F4810DRAFT_375776 [Camillea tinctor]|nr:hypothetical protein F4810DRAFT_375776 [Camillea tinctor]